MKALVFGFFNKDNLGDEFFKESYRCLFPYLDFEFVSKIEYKDLIGKAAVFFGGGSFLDGEPNITKELLDELKKKKIFYLGIGAETEIHPWHKFLIKNARLVAARSEISRQKLQILNSKTILCPDLVYSLQDKVRFKKKEEKTILYLPNAHTISKWNSPVWVHNSWEMFKSECSQAFEHFISLGYTIDVLPMCSNKRHKDESAAVEIENKMIKGSLCMLPYYEYNFSELSELVSGYELVISQRFHGLVVADMTNSSSINIHHHDKLKHFSGVLNYNFEYYGTHKNGLISAIEEGLNRKSKNDLNPLVINSNSFEQLKEEVQQIINSKD